MRVLLTALPLLLTTPAMAQDLTLPEGETLARVIDSLCIDLHPTNGCENIFLLENTTETDTADLIILPDRRTDATEPLIILRQAVYNGAMWGMSPSLEAPTEGEGFLLHSEQTGIGRFPWTQSLRIMWLEDQGFYVTSYAYSAYDRIGAGGVGCDLNFLQGHATTEIFSYNPETDTDTTQSTNSSIDLPPIPLADWQVFGPTPEPCRSAFDQFYAGE